MKPDLSKDHKLIDGMVIYTESGQVVNGNGTLMGTLPKGEYPATASAIIARLKEVHAPKKKVEEVKKEEPKKKPKQMYGLRRK